jgi:hypothetical protein
VTVYPDIGWHINYLCIDAYFHQIVRIPLAITVRTMLFKGTRVAIWCYNRIVMAVTVVMCITNIGFLMYGT